MSSAPPPAPGSGRARPQPVARVRSWLLDWLVVGAWLGVLALVGLLVRPMLPEGDGSATTLRQLLTADVLVTVGTVVPYLLYLSLTESSSRRATLGKRWARLRVAAVDGSPPATGAVWLRNVVKALPWQLGHMGFLRGVLETQAALGITLSVAGTLLGLACGIPALVGGRGLHDRVAGTRVDRAGPHGREHGGGR